MVRDLLENNGGCRLPCWWGIVPGKTPWVEARRFLSQFAFYIGEGPERSTNKFYASVMFPPPPVPLSKNWKEVPYLTQDYEVEDGMIHSIIPYNFDLAPAYFLPTFLKTYGQPGEIWIRTFSEEDQSQPFLLDLFFS